MKLLRITKAIRQVLIVVCGLIAATNPTLALRLPMGGIASQNKLQENLHNASYAPAGSYNITYVPLLLDLAKAIGKFQVSPHYYLQNEPFSNYPGIDLRSLLYSQSSPLRIPAGLLSPEKVVSPQPKASPHIAVPGFKDKTPSPEPKQHMPDYLQLSVSPLSQELSPMPVSQPKARIGPPEVNVPVEPLHLTSLPHLITADFPGFSTALWAAESPAQQFHMTTLEPPRLHSTFSKAHSTPEPSYSPSNKMFMLWTVKHTAKATITGSKDLPLPESPIAETRYQGTFVACMEGVHFQSIHGRKFTFDRGRLLAANKGEEMVFDTSVGNIHMNADTAAIIDLNGRQVLRVLSLHSGKSNKITVVLKSSSQQPESMSLATGEELIVSNHNLSTEEIKGSDGFERSQVCLNGKLARAKVSLAQVLEKERLLNPRVSALSTPQRSAIVQLRQSVPK
ncbi:MAG: hypothetical protein HY711_04500 [Candidatus Melainabacteria bacterium]|nr:hypothetical protein [Candidatus Melainabacteria bacterium]